MVPNGLLPTGKFEFEVCVELSDFKEADKKKEFEEYRDFMNSDNKPTYVVFSSMALAVDSAV